MGRKAGISTEDIKTDLLAAAAKVFAREGFDGASIADITAEAGQSSGPIYVHFGGKAELFAAVLEANTDRELDKVLGDIDRHDAPTVLATLGSRLSNKEARTATLLIEAITTARRDPTVAKVLAQIFARRQARLATLISESQARGVIDPRVSAETVAHFSIVVGLGSLLVSSLAIPQPDQPEWAELISAVVRSMRSR